MRTKFLDCGILLQEMESYSPPANTGDAKGKRAKKDPNAPKRPQSAYLIFSQAESKKIRAANPEMAVSQVMKEAAARSHSFSGTQSYDKNLLPAL
jgi:hypothetical protein